MRAESPTAHSTGLCAVAPSSRVFKIRKKVVYDFVEFSTSKRGMIKWVTPLGRVFKIHLKFPHEIGKVFVRQGQLIFNIQSSKIVV